MAATSPSKENVQILLSNANAAAVLSELGLSEEDSCPPPKSTTKPTRRPSSSTHKVFTSGMTKTINLYALCMYLFRAEPPLVIPRSRHYDAEKVRVCLIH